MVKPTQGMMVISDLRFVGRLFVKALGKPIKILPKLIEMTEFLANEELELYEDNIVKRLLGVDSNISPNSSKDLHDKEPIDEDKIDKKKGQGLSKLNLASGQLKPKELERNEFGQLIEVQSL